MEHAYFSFHAATAGRTNPFHAISGNDNVVLSVIALGTGKIEYGHFVS
jgi:hypothetical protein